MKKNSFKSSDMMTEINYVEYEETQPRACVIIAHGIGEYAERYEALAEFLTKRNIVVFALDFIGHGESVSKSKAPMYFGEKGWDFLAKDLISLNKIAKEKYPEVPCFLMGFSMGSFVVRTVLAEYGEEVNADGAILAGTGSISMLLAKLVQLAVSAEAKKCGGPDKVSDKVNELAFGNYNKYFKPCATEFDWLCKNEEGVKEYMEDSKAKKFITPGMFYELLDGMARVSTKRAIKETQKIPLLFLFGEEDPVGGFGEGVKKLIKSFRANNFFVNSKAYPNSRHDIFHDNDKEAVYMEIYNWIEKQL